MDSDAPDGFKPFRHGGEFGDLTGPIHYRKLADGGFGYGFRVEQRHLNPNGAVHGGMLFTFADQFIGRIVVGATRRLCTTIKLNVEYVAPGQAGAWIEGRGEALRLTRDLAYMRGRVGAGHHTLMTAQGIWRLLDPI